MRRNLIDSARRKLTAKRGGGNNPMALDESQPSHILVTLHDGAPVLEVIKMGSHR